MTPLTIAQVELLISRHNDLLWERYNAGEKYDLGHLRNRMWQLTYRTGPNPEWAKKREPLLERLEQLEREITEHRRDILKYIRRAIWRLCLRRAR